MTKYDSFDSANAERLVLQAESFASLREWQSADECFRHAMKVDPTPSSRIAFGKWLAEHERYFEAISVFTPVLDGSDHLAIGIVCHNLAAIYRDLGDADLARRFQWRSTLSQESSGEEDLLALANDALAAEHSEIAASLIMNARELNGNDTDDCADGDLVAMTGLVKAALNSTEDAILTIFAAYRRHQVATDFRGMGADLMNMAILFGELDRHRAERACIVRAIHCFQQASAPHSFQRARQLLERFDRMQAIRTFDVRRN